jgi:hypothetical protein
MRIEDAPEEWLVKASDGPVMIDVVFESLGIGEITREMVDAAEHMYVAAIRIPVMSIEDVLLGKLLALSEQELDYGPLIEIARSLRESIDWRQLRSRTRASPYARAFFGLLAELDVLAARPEGSGAAADAVAPDRARGARQTTRIVRGS